MQQSNTVKCISD